MNTKTNGVALALTGRVPCFVQGPINKGDLVTTSQIAGVAQAVDPLAWVPGCVIGKSLETIEDTDIKKIEIAVGRY
jgi:molybdenum cofactor biosynthesis enzyme